jgi:hypothetical protein
MKWKAIFAVLAALLVAPVLNGAEAPVNAAAYAIDVDSATVTYFRHVGQNNDPFGGSIAGPATIKTTGSSITVVEAVASSAPFADINVGDILIVIPPATRVQTSVRVETKASSASITVFPAVDLGTGVAWRYYQLQSGTTGNDGWFNVSGAAAVSLGVYWELGDLDTLKVRWECRSHAINALPMLVFPGATSECGVSGSATAVPGFCTTANANKGLNSSVTLSMIWSGYSECRVGLAFGSTDAADTAGSTEENVRISVDVLRSTP